MVIRAKHNEHVFEEPDHSEGPEYQAKYSKEIHFLRVVDEDGRVDVKRRSTQVPIHDAQSLVSEQQCSPPAVDLLDGKRDTVSTCRLRINNQCS